LIAVLAVAFVPAQAVEIGKYAGEFLSTGVGARALGMGGAYVAFSGDVTTGYWNPAGLSTITYPEAAAMHSRRFGGVVNYDYAGVAVPFRQQDGLGLSVIRLAVDDIPYTALPRPDLAVGEVYTDEQGREMSNRPYVTRMVNDAEYGVFLSYAHRHNHRFSYGANVKFVSKRVGDHSAWGIGFDVGVIWNPVERLLVGANLQDATTTLLAWNTGTRELIAPTLKTGLGYPIFFRSLNTRLIVALDTDFRFEGREYAAQAHLGPVSADTHIGTELLFRRIVAIRLGADTGHLTAGAGLHLPRLDIDYAFLSHDEFESTHRVSIRLRLEEERFARD
jgi:hypothetical protein